MVELLSFYTSRGNNDMRFGLAVQRVVWMNYKDVCLRHKTRKEWLKKLHREFFGDIEIQKGCVMKGKQTLEGKMEEVKWI